MPKIKARPSKTKAPLKKAVGKVARRAKKATRTKRLAIDEPTLWKGLNTLATDAFDFWHKFFDLRMGPRNDQALGTAAIANFRAIIRCVSWVESKHGSSGANFPARDPLQCGHPADAWFKVLIGGSPKTERFVGGPTVKNYWAEELPGAAEADAAFPALGKISYLADKTKGHKDAKFNSNTSFYWGVPFLIQKINKPSSSATYKCDDAAKARMIDGAVAYNGGGDPQYRTKIEDAWRMIIGAKEGGKTRRS